MLAAETYFWGVGGIPPMLLYILVCFLLLWGASPQKTGNDIFRRFRPFPVFVVDDTSDFFFTFFPIFFRVVRKKYNYFYNNKLTTSDINHLPTKILTFPITS